MPSSDREPSQQKSDKFRSGDTKGLQIIQKFSNINVFILFPHVPHHLFFKTNGNFIYSGAIFTVYCSALCSKFYLNAYNLAVVFKHCVDQQIEILFLVDSLRLLRLSDLDQRFELGE